MLVRLAVETDSSDYAVARLVDFAGAVVETDTVAVDALGSALALVAASFPDADLSAVAGGAGGRGVSDGAPSALDAARAAGPGAVADGLAVWPNPTGSRGTVRLSVRTAARHATAAVYDALGRRVAVLHDGPLGAGAHDFALDASSFAPGLYVVHVRVAPAEGSVWTEVRRVTVAR